MAEESYDMELSWEPDFEIIEEDETVEIGFESPGESPMFNDHYEPDRWLNYLLDPGEAAAPVSDRYHTNTAALQLVGLTLVDELLENDETRETVLEYEEDIQEMTMLGYSEQLRAYANDIAMKMEELD